MRGLGRGNKDLETLQTLLRNGLKVFIKKFVIC